MDYDKDFEDFWQAYKLDETDWPQREISNKLRISQPAVCQSLQRTFERLKLIADILYNRGASRPAETTERQKKTTKKKNQKEIKKESLSSPIRTNPIIPIGTGRTDFF